MLEINIVLFWVWEVLQLSVSLHKNKLLLWSKFKASMCNIFISVKYRQSLFNIT